jgi:hypothetical protein
MSTIINRLRWLSAGVYLGLALFAWLEQDSKKNKLTPAETKLRDTYNNGQVAMNNLYNHYKTKQKETTNA